MSIMTLSNVTNVDNIMLNIWLTKIWNGLDANIYLVTNGITSSVKVLHLKSMKKLKTQTGIALGNVRKNK